MQKNRGVEKHRIGIDIDDCIGDIQSTFCKLAKKFFGHKLNPEECTSESGKFTDMGLITAVETRRIVTSKEYIESLKSLVPFPFAIRSINILLLSVDLFFITSRDNYSKDKMKEDIYDWLRTVGVRGRSTVVFAKEKGVVAKRLGLDLVIEDAIKYTRQIIKHKSPVILIKRPWNKGFKHLMVVKADSWKDVPKLVEQILFKG